MRVTRSPPQISDTVSHNSTGRSSSRTKDARTVKTDKALRAGLLRLLETVPFEQVTVRMICAEAGVHYATFFRHHPSKEALLDHLASAEIDQLIERTVPKMSESMEAAFLDMCSYVNENRALWTVLLTGGARAAMREELLKASMAVAADVGRENEWLPIDLATLCTTAVHIEALSWWLKQPPELYSVEQMAKMVRRLVLAPTMMPGL